MEVRWLSGSLVMEVEVSGLPHIAPFRQVVLGECPEGYEKVRWINHPGGSHAQSKHAPKGMNAMHAELACLPFANAAARGDKVALGELKRAIKVKMTREEGAHSRLPGKYEHFDPSRYSPCSEGGDMNKLPEGRFKELAVPPTIRDSLETADALGIQFVADGPGREVLSTLAMEAADIAVWCENPAGGACPSGVLVTEIRSWAGISPKGNFIVSMFLVEGEVRYKGTFTGGSLSIIVLSTEEASKAVESAKDRSVEWAKFKELI